MLTVTQVMFDPRPDGRVVFRPLDLSVTEVEFNQLRESQRDQILASCRIPAGRLGGAHA